MARMKRTFLAFLLAAALTASATAQDSPAPTAAVEETAETGTAQQDRLQWWREARLGMFIHYGLYSGLGGQFRGIRAGGEWIQKNLEMDTDTYAREALPLFKPAEGCAERWVQLAKDAGCRYAVLTTKHHEGFALFDSKLSSYTSAKVHGRDIVKEFADACHAQGLGVGFYHSVIDWHQKDYDNTICPDLCYPKNQAALLKFMQVPRNHDAYCDYLHGMVRELLTNYGKVDILWWDYSQGAASGDRGWKAGALRKMCRELQPHIIMNNRLYAAPTAEDGTPNGDFMTPEKQVPTRDNMPTYDWESCITVGHHWGYSINDRDFKSPQQVISLFEDCLAHGGNMLLNIGPKADGSVTELQENVFRRLGDWMKVNSEAVYGSTPLTEVDLPESLRMIATPTDSLYVFLPPAPQEEEEEADAPAETPLAGEAEIPDAAKGADSETAEGEEEELSYFAETGEYVLYIPAEHINDVTPSILGQPDCKVAKARVENPQDEEDVMMRFIIPASAWQNAVEGLPVLKLEEK